MTNRYKVRIFDLVENHTLNPNSTPTRSLQARSSASHVDSYRSRPVYHRTHTLRSQTCQSSVSETHGLSDHHDGTAQTMLSSVHGSALAFAVRRPGYFHKDFFFPCFQLIKPLFGGRRENALLDCFQNVPDGGLSFCKL